MNFYFFINDDVIFNRACFLFQGQVVQGLQVPQVNQLQVREAATLYARGRRHPLILNQMQVKVSWVHTAIQYIVFITHSLSYYFKQIII